MKYSTILSVILTAVLSSCGGGESKESEKPAAPTVQVEVVAIAAVIEEADPMENVGIGPIDELEFDEEIDTELAAGGKEIYEAKCMVCHKATEKHIGPAPLGIFERRNPAWVMNMMLNPDEMLAKDPIAQALFLEFGTLMTDQGLTLDEARSIVEYFRTLEAPIEE